LLISTLFFVTMGAARVGEIQGVAPRKAGDVSGKLSVGQRAVATTQGPSGIASTFCSMTSMPGCSR
jgi:hypothetical protein